MKKTVARRESVTAVEQHSVRSPLSITQHGVRIGSPSPITPAIALLRPGRIDDVPQIVPLLDTYVQQGLVLPRSEEQIYRTIREFTVAVDTDGIVGCGALRLYSAELAEIGALAVHERAHGKGIGSAIVQSLVDEAVHFGVSRVFAMTLQEPFFHKLGFRTVKIAEFPQKIAADCTGCIRAATCAEIAVVRELGENIDRRS
jgi:amino-acid N-acetyltransferase